MLGRLAGLRDAADRVIVTYTYDTAGRLAREDKGNGTYTVHDYDDFGRVESIEHHAPSGAIIGRFGYAYSGPGPPSRGSRLTTLDGVVGLRPTT